jgi:hypothetical protein
MNNDRAPMAKQIPNTNHQLTGFDAALLLFVFQFGVAELIEFWWK